MEQLHEDLWVLKRPLRFLGLELGCRMTVLRVGEDPLLHSPVAPDEALLGELDALGRVRWVLGPNRYHHLGLSPWVERGVELFGVPALARHRKDLDFTMLTDSPWDGVDVLPLSCIPFTDEVVLLHRPSRTLIVTDLLFNLPESTGWWTKANMWAMGGYPGVCCTVLERALIKREPARKDFEQLLSWDFDRVVLGHGDVVEEGGRDALAEAYSWL